MVPSYEKMHCSLIQEYKRSQRKLKWMRIACKEEGSEILRTSLAGYVGRQELHIDLLSVWLAIQFLF